MIEKKSMRRWENGVTIPYLKGEIIVLNFPLLIIIFFLMVATGIYVLAYMTSGTGSLKVIIEKDPKSQAFFSVKLSKKANENLTQMKKQLVKGMEDKKYDKKTSYISKYEQSMVLKEADFKKIHAGSYYVYLYGIFEAGMDHRQIGNYQMTKDVKIAKDKVAKVIFDLRPTTSYTEIFLHDGDIKGTTTKIKYSDLKILSLFIKSICK